MQTRMMWTVLVVAALIACAAAPALGQLDATLRDQVIAAAENGNLQALGELAQVNSTLAGEIARVAAEANPALAEDIAAAVAAAVPAEALSVAIGVSTVPGVDMDAVVSQVNGVLASAGLDALSYSDVKAGVEQFRAAFESDAAGGDDDDDGDGLGRQSNIGNLVEGGYND